MSLSPPTVPVALRHLKNWLVWRLVQKDDQPKPSKIPYYVGGAPRPGRQGTPEDRAALVTFDEAVACVQRAGGHYHGVGFAPFADSGVVALDFDGCVDERGVIDPRVEVLCEGTYTEISPSGRGVRAFFIGSLLSKSDAAAKQGPFPVEVYGTSGYVTVTGNVTETCALMGWDQVVAPLSDAVRSMYASRGWGSGDVSALLGSMGLSGGGGGAADGEADANLLMSVTPGLGMSNDEIQRLLAALPVDLDYDTWVKVGMAVHHETDGKGFALWDAWSRLSPKYTTEKYGSDRWRSFGRAGGGAPVTMGFVRRMADEYVGREKYEAAQEWKRKLRDCHDEYELREKLCAKVRKDSSLSDIDRESLAQVVQTALRDLGTKLPIAECRALVAQPEASRAPTVTTARPLTEFGNAERMLDQYANELMYVPELGSWYCWTGIYWRKASDVEIEFRAKQTIMRLPNEAEQNANSAEFFAFCAISQAARMVRNMVQLATSDPRVMVPVSELDKHSHLIGVRNGVVDLTSGHLMPADPKHRITKVCGCDYVPGATAPLFEQTIRDVFNDEPDMVDYFWRSIGYSAMGRPTEDVLYIPFGNGSNGKSTVLGTIRRAFGGYAKAADAGSFIAEGKGGNAGGAREDLIRLKGSRFVYVNEPDENGELREGAVKSMTGGDAIPARGVYAKESVEIVPTWVVFMPTNHKPIIKGSDNGIWRRIVLLPFTRNFDADKTVAKDTSREDKLTQELTGVLTWIVQGALQYQRRGLSAPKTVAAARDQYRSQMDLLAEWLEDCCDIGPEYTEKSDRLWQSWEQFAKNRGIIQYVKSSVALGRRLDSRFSAVKGSRGVRLRSGLRLKPDFPDVTVAGVAGVDLFQ